MITNKDFIGYQDLFNYITSELEPFIDKTSTENWGIVKPAGAILYGPPGSGKIFWANKIAEITGYEFRELRKHYLGSPSVAKNKSDFNAFLLIMMKGDKTLLFMEDFDEIMAEKSATAENEETKEIILHNISKFPEEGLLMVGSANSLTNIDDEIFAPARFDVLIPIFPPSPAERADMLLHFMTDKISKTSTLSKILKLNNAYQLAFWQPVAEKMKAYSNTMLIDFTQILKKRIKTLYQKSPSADLKIEKTMIDGALRDASAKMTSEYLDQVSRFLYDVTKNNAEDFPGRISTLKTELDSYRATDKPASPIGFQHNA